jgi:DNA-binding response OmpR family regulator
MTSFTLHKLELAGPQSRVKLTQSEAQMLKAFVHSKDLKLSFEALNELLSLKARDAQEKAALQVRMVRLRKKLHACGAEGAVIESVRNVGYQLFEPIQIL